jgi:hypothetical protein
VAGLASEHYASTALDWALPGSDPYDNTVALSDRAGTAIREIDMVDYYARFRRSRAQDALPDRYSAYAFSAAPEDSYLIAT